MEIDASPEGSAHASNAESALRDVDRPRLESERERWSTGGPSLSDELQRQRSDRQAEREAHAQSLAALRQAWDAERSGWREQIEAVRLHAERERAALQALTELLRDEAERAVRRLSERDDQLVALAGAIQSHRAEPAQNDAAVDPASTRTHAELDQLRRQRNEAVSQLDALAAELQQTRDAAAAERESLRAEVDRLHQALAAVPPPRPTPIPTDRALVLIADHRRWTIAPPPITPAPPLVTAVPVGPPPLPPSLDDLEAVEVHVAMLRNLLRIAAPPGKPYHTQFDVARFQTIQAKLREANLLGDRLVSQFERSRNQKDLLWHLMVAQRNDEINRKKR